MAACDDGDECPRDGTHNGMYGIPGMIDEWNLVGDKVNEREDDESGDTPVLSNKSKAWVHRVEVQPSHRKRVCEQRQVGVQAGGKCQAKGCTEVNEIHDAFLPGCSISL